MSTFVHSPDNNISIDGDIYPLSVFRLMEPEYTLQDGVTGVVYHQNKVLRHRVDGVWVAQPVTSWADGDTYLSKAEIYKDFSTAHYVEIEVFQQNWKPLLLAIYPNIDPVPPYTFGVTVEEMTSAWGNETYPAPTHEQLTTAWIADVLPSIELKEQETQAYAAVLRDLWYPIVTADPEAIEAQLLTVQQKLLESQAALGQGDVMTGLTRMLESQAISAQLGQTAMEHIKVVTLVVRELMRRGIAQDVLTNPEEF